MPMRGFLVVPLAILTLAAISAAAAARNGLTAAPEHVIAYFPEFTFGTGGGEIVCELELDITFHESIPKSIGTLAGFLNFVFYEETCEGGAFGLLEAGGRRVRGLVRYHVTFEGFEGTLPNITSVSLLVAPHFWLEFAGGLAKCLSEANIRLTSAGGNPVTGFLLNEAITGLRNIGGLFCPETLTFTGNGSIFREKEHRSPASIRIGLI